MNKEQMARKLAEKMDISLVESRTYINTILDIMVEGLETEEYVSISSTPIVAFSPESQDGRGGYAYSPKYCPSEAKQRSSGQTE